MTDTILMNQDCHDIILKLIHQMIQQVQQSQCDNQIYQLNNQSGHSEIDTDFNDFNHIILNSQCPYKNSGYLFCI